MAAHLLIERVRFGAEMDERKLPVHCRFESNVAGSLQGFVGFFRAGLLARENMITAGWTMDWSVG